MGLFNWFKKKKVVDNPINETKSFRSMTIDDIWSLNDQNAFNIAMSGWLDKKCKYGDCFDSLTPEEKAVYVFNSFLMEVNNGGFEQFLFNSSGAFYGELENSLLQIGAEDILRVYQDAFRLLPKTLPQNENERDEVLFSLLTDERIKVLQHCDTEFYNLSNIDCEELLYRFTINHKESFQN